MLESWWSPIGSAGKADVFHVDLSPNPAKENEALSLLDGWERDRQRRLSYPGPRRRFALCRAALRLVLCQEFGYRNDELQFGVSYYEKPFAIMRGERCPINFNVSHSGNHGLIAFASEGRVGVDVEEFDPGRKLELLVESAFTPAERTELNSAEGADRHRLFFRFWTIKEALIKGVGMGLYLDMSSFQVPFEMRRGAHSAAFSFPQAPSVNWQLESLDSDVLAATVAHEISPITPVKI